MKKKYTSQNLESIFLSLENQKSFNISEVRKESEKFWKAIKDNFLDKTDSFGFIDFYKQRKQSYLDLYLKKFNLVKESGFIYFYKDNLNLPFFAFSDVILKDFTEKELWEWSIANNLPEDPFLVLNGKLLVETISHEGKIYLYLDDEQYMVFSKANPNFKLVELNQ